MAYKQPNSIVKKVFRIFNDIIPNTRWGDNVVSTASFLVRHGRLPDDRKSMNDILHRIKVSDEMLRPERALTSCKALVKDYVSARCGIDFVVPTIAWLTSEEEIRSYAYPDNCVIKPSHASGRVIIRKDGEEFNIEEVCSWLELDYYHLRREINYRYLTRGAIVEPILFGGEDVLDFKVFCYKGEPRAIQVDIDRHGDHRRNLYDTDWQMKNFTIAHNASNQQISRPTRLNDMLDAARTLSEDFDFVRVDFYAEDQDLYVGEITHCHGSGWEKTIPLSAEKDLSKLLFD